MGLPDIRMNKSKLRRQTIRFGGLNLSDTAGDGELVACENLSTRRWPLLAPRRGRTQTAPMTEREASVTATVTVQTAGTGGSGIQSATVQDWDVFLARAESDEAATYTFSAMSRSGSTVTWIIQRESGGMVTALGNSTNLWTDWGITFTGTAEAGALNHDSITVDVTAVSYTTVYPGADDIYEWDGVLVTAIGGVLYYGGEKLCNVSTGQHQFAVVNTKLCVWPDRILVDLENRSVQRLAVGITNAGGASFTTSTLTLSNAGHEVGSSENLYRNGSGAAGPWFWTYESVSWDAETGEWTLTGAAITSLWNDYSSDGRYYIPAVSYGKTGEPVFAMPQLLTWSGSRPDAEGYPEPEPGNTEGYYAKISVESATIGIYWSSGTMRRDFYNGNYEDVAEPVGAFSAGEALTVEGTKYGWYDVEKATVVSVDTGTDTITFKAGTFRAEPVCVAEVSVNIPAGASVRISYDGSGTYFVPSSPIEAGCVAVAVSGQVVIWDPESKAEQAAYPASTTGRQRPDVSLTGAAYDTADEPFTVNHSIPDLDYICESNNRLWGVSNADRTIYASALGQPGIFYDYSGLATDSYAVAVGSENDFTAICAYGDAVCCWKERYLHKILGDYPAEYYMVAREMAGVQAGSSRSLVNVNDVLYYKGIEGVFAYAGSTPTLVSAAFGNVRYSEAAAGSDDIRYRISMRCGENWHLMTYDTMTGLWMREDATHATAFALVGNELTMLKADGSIWTLDRDADTDAAPEEMTYAWSATFAPFTERDAHERKNYLRLLLRADPQGSAVNVEVSYETGNWISAGTVGAGKTTAVIPVRPNRIDRLRLRLSGTAPAAIESLAREFTQASIWGGESL